jgi:hypothetical protein
MDGLITTSVALEIDPSIVTTPSAVKFGSWVKTMTSAYTTSAQAQTMVGMGNSCPSPKTFKPPPRLLQEDSAVLFRKSLTP